MCVCVCVCVCVFVCMCVCVHVFHSNAHYPEICHLFIFKDQYVQTSCLGCRIYNIRPKLYPYQ